MKVSKEQLECNLTVINIKFIFPFPGLSTQQGQFSDFSLLKKLIYCRIQLESSLLKSKMALLATWEADFEERAHH